MSEKSKNQKMRIGMMNAQIIYLGLAITLLCYSKALLEAIFVTKFPVFSEIDFDRFYFLTSSLSIIVGSTIVMGIVNHRYGKTTPRPMAILRDLMSGSQRSQAREYITLLMLFVISFTVLYCLNAYYVFQIFEYFIVDKWGLIELQPLRVIYSLTIVVNLYIISLLK